MYSIIYFVEDIGMIIAFILGCVQYKWKLIALSSIGFFTIPLINEIVYNTISKALFKVDQYKP